MTMDNQSSNPGQYADILALAEQARSFLEPRWALFREAQRGDGVSVPESSSPSYSMCRLTARFMLNVLDKTFPSDDWEVVGGASTPGEDTDGYWGGSPAGMQDTQGRWHGHYWLENCDGLIVDITADQFGWESVIVITSDDDERNALYRGNYADWALQEHMRRVSWTSSEWLGEWKQENDIGYRPASP